MLTGCAVFFIGLFFVVIGLIAYGWTCIAVFAGLLIAWKYVKGKVNDNSNGN